MNIDKLREAWQLGNPKVFRVKTKKQFESKRESQRAEVLH